jgi:ABC-type Fe3+-hydroxamate transport system substrate-binding protein
MLTRTAADDTGTVLELPVPVSRVVSLVPSLTEAIGETAPSLLVGVTDWCTHPPGLDCARVGGTKNPDLAAVTALAPDVVLAAVEENRAADLAALRATGLPVWLTDIRDVPSALASLGRLLAGLGLGEPPWLVAARQSWAAPPPGLRRRVAVPIWRRPWMVVGADTFTADVLARMGYDNVFDDPPTDMAGRYPQATPDEIRARGAEVIVLPDEPYRFTAADGPEAFPDLPVALVSGRLLTWYGPSMATARAELARAVAGARPGGCHGQEGLLSRPDD